MNAFRIIGDTRSINSSIRYGTHLQNEIDWEIRKIGGENMLISREDLIHWVYYEPGGALDQSG